MIKEICAALLEADVNVRLVGNLRKSIKSSVNFKELAPGVNKKKTHDSFKNLSSTNWSSSSILMPNLSSRRRGNQMS
jgi:hypothetical protein